jgi:hypothetical protein
LSGLVCSRRAVPLNPLIRPARVIAAWMLDMDLMSIDKYQH